MGALAWMGRRRRVLQGCRVSLKVSDGEHAQAAAGHELHVSCQASMWRILGLSQLLNHLGGLRWQAASACLDSITIFEGIEPIVHCMLLPGQQVAIGPSATGPSAIGCPYCQLLRPALRTAVSVQAVAACVMRSASFS